MTAIGIDLGGSKIEAQVFDNTWDLIARDRCATPDTYDGLLAALAQHIRWAQGHAGADAPIGISAAGLLNPASGLVFAANLPASGHALPADIAAAISRPVAYINDARALTVSEAVFGAGRGLRCVASLVLGTGIGGGVAINGVTLAGPSGTGGEVGHTSAPAHLIQRHALPLWPCGCGRAGCVETYVSGPGLVRLAGHLTGQTLSTEEIAARRHGDMAQVWAVWSALAGDLVHTLTATLDPDVIVLAGGLSRIEGIIDDVTDAARTAQIGGLPVAPIVLAQGGDASGAKGAAFTAYQQGDRYD
ncbi:ROK family protein [Pseudooctadecabacter jejudonensis]|uniref:N-acetyl-D-glucosamine kinase n=1 Tax=Pseudooctadecabacter jejudonensis TaxID=1391910 RepID=A0A1Y5SDH9_9RHOB|nr:ROK family protein [Pseudooctadecabacter jejudonensis]SLN38202.1 N-acetyl-D-glucosamine kinase [Pseudooctadecabacter jejudonensis]